MEPCPAGCGRLKQPDHALCRDCWWQVSSELRWEVNERWRMRGEALRSLRAGLRSREDYLALAAAHQAARDRAIAYVKERQEAPR